jgi:hypothetical protein
MMWTIIVIIDGLFYIFHMQPPRSLRNKAFGYPDGIKNRELPIKGLTGSIEVKGIS